MKIGFFLIMKGFKLAIVFKILLLLALSSCTRDRNSNIGLSLSNTLRQGNWVVSLYNKNGNDRLYLFGGYKFSFATNGNVTATKNTVSAIGMWSAGTGNGKSYLFLDFGSGSDFSELNKNWESLEVSNSIVRFQFVNGGGNDNDFLSFELR